MSVVLATGLTKAWRWRNRNPSLIEASKSVWINPHRGLGEHPNHFKFQRVDCCTNLLSFLLGFGIGKVNHWVMDIHWLCHACAFVLVPLSSMEVFVFHPVSVFINFSLAIFVSWFSIFYSVEWRAWSFGALLFAYQCCVVNVNEPFHMMVLKWKFSAVNSFVLDGTLASWQHWSACTVCGSKIYGIARLVLYLLSFSRWHLYMF